MGAPFLIFGLPRSRTAWLAAFLNGPGIRCEHDLLGRCKSFGDLGRYLGRRSEGISGNADSGMLFYIEQVLEAVPAETRLVLVERAAEEVRESWERLEAGVLEPILPQLADAIATLKGRADVLVIPFAELDDHMRGLWDHVTCETLPFPEERFELFQRFNIQLSREAFLEGMLEAAVNIQHLEEYAQ